MIGFLLRQEAGFDEAGNGGAIFTPVVASRWVLVLWYWKVSDSISVYIQSLLFTWSLVFDVARGLVRAKIFQQFH